MTQTEMVMVALAAFHFRGPSSAPTGPRRSWRGGPWPWPCPELLLGPADPWPRPVAGQGFSWLDVSSNSISAKLPGAVWLCWGKITPFPRQPPTQPGLLPLHQVEGKRGLPGLVGFKMHIHRDMFSLLSDLIGCQF